MTNTFLYKYEFQSPEPLYAKVKEELKSYFETGAVDDLLFPVWTRDCLRKFAKSSLPIRETVLYLDNFSAILPRGFDSVREAWLCTTSAPRTIRKPGAFYSQIITLLNPDNDPCNKSCHPIKTELIYKTTTDEIYTTPLSHLLRPGNISAFNKCGPGCPNKYAPSTEEFDIRDGKFWTNFREGDVYLRYYANELDPNNYQLIPVNEAIEHYLESYLKYKVFEMLSNQVIDETSNQINNKMIYYKQLSDEAKISAETEVKKQTVDQKINTIRREMSSLNRYIIK